MLLVPDRFLGILNQQNKENKTATSAMALSCLNDKSKIILTSHSCSSPLDQERKKEKKKKTSKQRTKMVLAESGAKTW